ncbi:phosphatase 2C-like domain-containing protein [Tribonema minus]|uniref:Phosphatase 2C-like domain-containing protein n=1 Tax=Tribonema minus TaxID=303371 RepID=A0A836CBM8_9STRA|nr:phosphatase 2C-like domain-containing protein [Tribonema minus]
MGEGCCFSVGNSVFKCSRFPPPGSPESGRLSTGGGAAEAPVRGSPPHPHHHHGRHQSAPASFAADSTGRVGTAGSQAIAAEALVEEAAAAAADGEEGDDGAAAGGGNDDGGAGAADAGADDAAAAAAAAADAAPPAAAAVGSIPEDAAVEEPVQEAEPAPAEKRQPPLGRVPGKMWIHAKTGPLKGQTLTVTEAGAALGRATDNDASIADKELSRRHSRIEYESDLDEFFLCDVGSLNGTYMQLVGPYANKYRLGLSDHFLVGRTGFSVNRFDYGVSERMGSRPSMEDKSTIIQDMAVAGLTGTHLWPQTFVGVFDGHGGAQASEYLWDNLHLRLADSLQARAGELSAAAAEIDSSMSTGEVGGDDVEGSFALLDGLVKQAFMEAFKATDDAFIKDSEHPQAGSTATTALILGGRVYVANVGDSRTIITREGRVLAASEDHKPQREDEEERIRNAGGFIVHKRVMGNLAVSRAFGDAEFKRGIGAHGPDADGLDSTSGGCAPLVISEPEFTVVQLTPAEDFMVLACDGLFDVFSNVEVVQAVCAEMAVHGDAQKCCESITLRAIRERHTRDNVTMILVMLRSTALSAADGEGDAASLPASPARTAAAAAAAAATAAAAVTASAAPSAAAAGGEVREEPDAKATA